MGLFNRKKNSVQELRQFYPLINQVFGTGFFSVERNAAVDAAVSRISNTISTLSLEMYQFTSRGIQDIWSNPIARLLKNPAVEESSTLFYQTLVRHILLKGNGYVFKHRDSKGNVVCLEIIDPMCIRVERFDDGRKKFIITGQRGGVYTERDVIQIPLIGEGYNGTWGVSPADLHKDIIRQNSLIQEFIALTINHGIGSRLLVELDKDTFKPGSPKLQPLVQEFSEYFTKFVYGNENAGKAVITPPGTKLGTIELPDLVKTEVVNLYEISCNEVYMLFNIPPEVINSKEQKYGSLEAKYQDFLRTAIHPLCSHIAKCFEKGLFSPDEMGSCFLSFNYDSMLDVDRAKKTESVLKEYHGGLTTLNEARRKLGMQAIENEVEGNTRIIPASEMPWNQTTIESFMARSQLALAELQEDKNNNHNGESLDKNL